MVVVAECSLRMSDYVAMANVARKLLEKGCSREEILRACYGVDFPEELFVLVEMNEEDREPNLLFFPRPFGLLTPLEWGGPSVKTGIFEELQARLSAFDPGLIALVILYGDHYDYSGSVLCYHRAELAQGRSTVFGFQRDLTDVTALKRYGDSLASVVHEALEDHARRLAKEWEHPSNRGAGSLDEEELRGAEDDLARATAWIATTAERKNASEVSEARLLAAIRVAPENDAPRAVYADALLARGDPRGEMIAVQLRLGELERLGPLSPVEREEGDRLIARQNELGERIGRIAPNVSAFLHRGFATRVLLRAGGEEELTRDPLFHNVLRELVVWRSSPELVLSLTRKLRREHLVLLREVVFNGPVGAESAKAIAGWGPLNWLGTLRFISSEVGRAGMETILRATRASGIRRLAVFNDSLEGFVPLALEACRGLEHLELSFCELGEADVAALARQPRGLRSLALNGNRFGDAGAEVLATSDAFGALERLDLTGCDLTAEGHRLLAEARFPPSLRLVLENEDIEPVALAALRQRYADVRVVGAGAG